MVSAAFTKGPWTRDGRANTIMGSNGEFVCDLDHVSGHDARLIASAPDLCEAVQAFVDAGNMSVFASGSDKALAVAFDKAEAALAKARGEHNG